MLRSRKCHRLAMCVDLVPDDYVVLGKELADAAGNAIRPYFRRVGGVSTDFKSDQSPVTVADKGAEDAMRTILKNKAPDDHVVGEEFGTSESSTGSDYTWVLDPIDGTKAFITGKPTFGTLIGLMNGPKTVLGIIDQPISGERWIGVHGRGSTLNGKPVKIPEDVPTKLSAANLHATTPEMFTGIERMAFEELQAACKYTNFGSDCYAYALLAMGHVHIICEADMKPWDYTALVPVIEEAGGVITDWRGEQLGLESDGTVLAAVSADLHRQALELLQYSPRGLLLLREREERAGSGDDLNDINDELPSDLPTAVGASSMTGFGTAMQTSGSLSVKVEIRTINSRHFDLSVKSPRYLAAHEREISAHLRQELLRGKVMVTIEVKDSEMLVLPIRVDADAVRAAKHLIEDVVKASELDVTPTLDQILRFSEVFVKKENGNVDDGVYTLVEKVVRAAVNDLKLSRRREGYALQLDLLRRSKAILEICEEIELRLPDIVEREKANARNLAAELSENISIAKDVNLSSVSEQLMGGRVDVSEELVRLKSHISVFELSFFSTKQIGQKLNFLVQEMNREVSTISSKASDAAVSQLCVMIKEQIERIREQVQNIV
ncbi:hypothetical protein NDN08_003595 [Rhodosorus marinus]|uniref:histidinol-phosphatase n=1 Tax=Rhodosorus marinus TaxID=101924 RepID=A0AAV8UWZ0_9RHOD|nr:hypothetical protein NDN08_003595 [Rhodosorus marinus]